MVAVACMVLLIAGSPVPAITTYAAAGVSIGALSALDGIVARDVVPAREIGTLMGVISLAAACGAGVAPVVAGRLTDATGTPVASAVMASGCALASVIMLAAARRRRTPAGEHEAGTVPR
jgi:sugar phosphate permease